MQLAEQAVERDPVGQRIEARVDNRTERCVSAPRRALPRGDLMRRHQMNLSAAAREPQHLRELIRKYGVDPHHKLAKGEVPEDPEDEDDD
ncbi:MAG: hypothetical protein ABI467_11135 [Kofleriaceae bacterium]